MAVQDYPRLLILVDRTRVCDFLLVIGPVLFLFRHIATLPHLNPIPPEIPPRQVYNTENHRFRPTHSRNLREYPHKAYIALYYQKLESLSYILPLIMWVGLHSNFRAGLKKKHLLCSRVLNGCSRLSKVIDIGRSNARMRFLISHWSRLVPFQTYCHSSTPQPYST